MPVIVKKLEKDLVEMTRFEGGRELQFFRKSIHQCTVVCFHNISLGGMNSTSTLVSEVGFGLQASTYSWIHLNSGTKQIRSPEFVTQQSPHGSFCGSC